MLLQASVVGLGFGMNLQKVVDAGRSGILFTLATIVGTLLARLRARTNAARQQRHRAPDLVRHGDLRRQRDRRGRTGDRRDG